MKKKNLTVIYGCTQCFYWVGYAAIFAFASMYLLDFGVSNSVIGISIAVANIVSALLQPVLGTLSDRNVKFSARKLAGIFMSIVVVMAVILLVTSGKNMGLLCLVYGVCILGMAMTQPFINSLAMRCINAGYTLNFGLSRAFGSAGYAACAFLLGQLADKFGVQVIPVTFMISYILGVLTLLFFPSARELRGTGDGQEQRDRKGTEPGKHESFFSKYPSFVIMLGGIICIYFGHVLINNFTLQIVLTKGGGNSSMGTATALAAASELAVMLFFSRLMKKVQLKHLLMFASVFFTLKVLGSLLVTNMTGYYLVQLMQMPGWGIMTVGLVYYVNELMAPEDCTKGQAWAGTSFTIASVIGAWIGGILIDLAGVNVMLITGTVISAVGTLIFITAAGGRSLKK